MTIKGLYIVVIINIECLHSRLKILTNSSPKLPEIGESSSPHPNNKMLIFRVNPLGLIWIRSLLELVSYIIWPRNSSLINRYLRASTLKLLGVIEDTSCYKSTRAGNLAWVKQGHIVPSLDVWRTKITIKYDWVTVEDGFTYRYYAPRQLRRVFWFNVSPMILIKVI